MAPFEIAVTSGNDRAVVRVAGEVDMSTAPRLLDSVLRTALVHERRHIVLDVRNVTFIDCTGLNALVEADQRVRSFNAHLIVCDPPKTMQRLLELTGLDDLLDVRPHWAADHLGAIANAEPLPTQLTRRVG